MRDASAEPTPAQLFRTVFPSIMLPMFLVVVGYLVATTVAAPVYGQLRDVYGSARMMFIALAIFITTSLFCAAATSVEMLTVGRILQGLGGGGLMTLSQA